MYMAVHAAQPNTVSVTFTTHFVVENDNQVIGVSGSIPELGSWRPESAFCLVSQGSGVWTRTLKIPTGTKFEWKLVLVDLSSCVVVRWEESLNRELHLNKGRQLYLKCRWGFPGVSENEESLENSTICGLDKHAENDIKFPKEQVAETKKKTFSSKKRCVRFISFNEDRDIDFEVNEGDEKQEIDELFGKYNTNEERFQQETKDLTLQRNVAAFQLKEKTDGLKVVKGRRRAFKRKIKKSASQDDSNGNSKVESSCQNYNKCVSNIDNDITDHDAGTGYKTIPSHSKPISKETEQQDFIFPIPAARNEIAKVHTKAQYIANENKTKKLNVRELKNLFEELSKEQFNKNYKRWSEDYDLLLKRKRVKLLRRLMLEKEHPEKYKGRHKLLKSSSAPNCPNDFFMGKIKDSVKHTEISEDDQVTIEKLYHELDLHEKDLQLETSPMSINYSTGLPSTPGYDIVNVSGLSRFSLSHLSRDNSNKVEGSISPRSKMDDELQKSATGPLRPRSADTRAELGDGIGPSLFPCSAHLIVDGSNEGLALSKTGNDECPSDKDTTNTDILALCRRHKVVTCTAVTSFLGLAVILAFTYLKLRK